MIDLLLAAPCPARRPADAYQAARSTPFGYLERAGRVHVHYSLGGLHMYCTGTGGGCGAAPVHLYWYCRIWRLEGAISDNIRPCQALSDNFRQ